MQTLSMKRKRLSYPAGIFGYELTTCVTMLFCHAAHLYFVCDVPYPFQSAFEGTTQLENGIYQYLFKLDGSKWKYASCRL